MGKGNDPNCAQAQPFISPLDNDYGAWSDEPDFMHGECGDFAHAMLDLRPDLQIGIFSRDGLFFHVFAHDDTHAYDASGRHPLPYAYLPGLTAEYGKTRDDIPVDYDADDPEDYYVMEAKRHLDRSGLLADVPGGVRAWDGWVTPDPSLAGVPAWQLTAEQFARHPDTLWHGSPIGRMGPGEIHVGTQRAAYQALRARMLGHGQYQGTPPGVYWDLGQPVPDDGFALPWNGDRHRPQDSHGEQLDPQLTPVQVHPQRMVSDSVFSDTDHDGDEFGWAEPLRLRVADVIAYRNDGEDAGSVSYVARDASAFATHEDLVRDAHDQGLAVPQDVLAAYGLGG